MDLNTRYLERAWPENLDMGPSFLDLLMVGSAHGASQVWTPEHQNTQVYQYNTIDA